MECARGEFGGNFIVGGGGRKKKISLKYRENWSSFSVNGSIHYNLYII